MKTKIYCMLIGLVSCILTSCGYSKGGSDYPQDLSSNEDQISGIIVSKPIEYDTRLGYKLAIDENRDGMFDNRQSEEHYAWMPNDIYYELLIRDSIVVKAVRFYENHGLSDCDEYIIFDWCLAVQDTLKIKKFRREKRGKRYKKKRIPGKKSSEEGVNYSTEIIRLILLFPGIGRRKIIGFISRILNGSKEGVSVYWLV